MTTETRHSVDAALVAHLASTEQLLVAYHIVYAAVSFTDERVMYGSICPNGQPLHATVGLLDVGRKFTADQWARMGGR